MNERFIDECKESLQKLLKERGDKAEILVTGNTIHIIGDVMRKLDAAEAEKDCEAGGLTPERVCRIFLSNEDQIQDEVRRAHSLLDEINGPWEKLGIRKCLIPEGEEEVLKNVPTITTGDITIAGTFDVNGWPVMVTDEVLKKFGVAEEAFLEELRHAGCKKAEFQEIIDLGEGDTLSVFAEDSHFGAEAVFDEGVQKELRDYFNGSFYVAFVNRNEATCFAGTMSIAAVLSRVLTMRLNEDYKRVSNMLYVYDTVAGSLKAARNIEAY